MVGDAEERPQAIGRRVQWPREISFPDDQPVESHHPHIYAIETIYSSSFGLFYKFLNVFG